MACEGNTCGTGGWGGPKPGDPDNTSTVLSATPAYGGIDVRWTYPTLNPHAVSHVLVYRAIIDTFEGAIFRATVSGDFYFDKCDPGVQYFYWIRIVSINGTTGDPIGPVDSSARPKIDQYIEELTGKIDAGMLAQSLKTPIQQIPGLDLKIDAETGERITANIALGEALNAVHAEVGEALTLFSEEITARTEGDNALVTYVNTVAAGNNTNAAAILEEKNLRITADSALASSIDTVISSVGSANAAIVAETTARTAADAVLAGQITTAQSVLNGNIAAAQTTLQTNINTVNGKVTSIGALYTAKVTVNGLIGGFGVYNDGTQVEAGFDVDTFWIGRTSANKRKPFIVVGSETFIDEAVINKLTFSKLRADDGSVIIEGGKLKAAYLDADNIVAKNINVKSAASGERIEQNNLGIRIYDGAGTLRLKLGNLA